ncbi:MAG: hypothetical protein Q4Q23_01975 [Methanobacteriaceae archaeon]|nr:hypothetical protein [Methanobacteriaceae archaeon]
MFKINEEEYIKKVLDVLRPLKGVEDVGLLDDVTKQKVSDIEFDRSGDLIPVVNAGVKKCLESDYTIAIVKTALFRPPPTATVQLVNNYGELLGEEIVSVKQKHQHEKNKNAHFINDEFVLFKKEQDFENDLKTENLKYGPEKQAFLLPPVSFEEVEDLPFTDNVVSSSPAPLADLFLKQHFGFEDDPKLASLLVGFSIK